MKKTFWGNKIESRERRSGGMSVPTKLIIKILIFLSCFAVESITIPLFEVFYLACHLFCFCLRWVGLHGKSLKSVKFTVLFRSSLHQFLSIFLIPTKFERLFQRKIKLISALGPWSLGYFRFCTCFRFLFQHGYSAFDSSIPRRDLGVLGLGESPLFFNDGLNPKPKLQKS